MPLKSGFVGGNVIAQFAGEFSLSRTNQNVSIDSFERFPSLIAVWTAPASWSILKWDYFLQLNLKFY